MNRPAVAVIVTFNRLEALKHTVARTLEEPFVRVVVVDNASTDGTGEWLASLDHQRLSIISHEENLGGAGGFHAGFKYAAEHVPEADWLVAFDDDAWPEPGTLETFERMDIPEDVGGLAAAVYLPNGRISEMNRPGLNPFWRFGRFFSALFRGREGFHISDAEFAESDSREIDISTFVGFFLRLSLLRENRIGLPRPELFIYADDQIFVLEMRKAGVKHLFAPQLRFKHDCDTLVDQKDVYRPLWKVYYTYRNRIEMWRVGTGWVFPLLLLIKLPGIYTAKSRYRQDEQKAVKRLTLLAVRHGLRSDFGWTIVRVQSICAEESRIRTA